MEKLIRGEWRDGRIENVLYVPDLKKNLFSVGVCTRNGMRAQTDADEVEIIFENRVIASGRKQENKVCRMLFNVVKPDGVDEVNAATTDLTV